MKDTLSKRLKIFSSHRRGYYSFWILFISYALSWFASLAFNHKPIYIFHQKKHFFPFLFNYSETEYGGVFESEADYKDSDFIAELSAQGSWILWPLIRFGPTEIDFNLDTPAPSPPSQKHWLGTDDRARDVLARLVFGARLSLSFGILLAILGTALGIIFGSIQGFFGGVVDLVGQRLVEIWTSLPELFILIILTSLFEPSITLIILLMTFMGWMGLSAYVRAEFLKARQFEYVTSAIAMGASRIRVMFLHILPNTLAPIITFFPFRVSGAIAGLASLDFLGLGVPQPTPSLGELLSQGKSNLHSWWIIIATFLVMVAMITMLNFVGEGVQKAMDPKAIESFK